MVIEPGTGCDSGDEVVGAPGAQTGAALVEKETLAARRVVAAAGVRAATRSRRTPVSPPPTRDVDGVLFGDLAGVLWGWPLTLPGSAPVELCADDQDGVADLSAQVVPVPPLTQ